MHQIQKRNNNNMPSASVMMMGVHSKVELIKYNRDYSFLFSGDADEVPPPPSYSQPPKKLPPKSQAARTTSAGTGHKKIGVLPAAARSGESTIQKPAVTSKLHHLQVRVPDSKKPFPRKEETRELSNKKPPPKSAIQDTGVPSRLHHLVSKRPLSRKGDSQEPRNSTAASSLTQKSAQQILLVPSRSHLPLSKQPLSRKEEIQEPRKPTTASSLTQKSAQQKPAIPSRLHPPVLKQPVSRKGASDEPKKPTSVSSSPPKSCMQKTKGEISQKQQMPRPSSNRKVIHQSQPLVKSSVSPNDHQPKKRPRSHDHEDEQELDYAISEIRKMFGYNPNKYVDDFYDDRNMVANFQEIEREEKKSSRLARKEDQEELRNIHEERRERLQKNAKKRKIENENRKLYEELGLLDDDDDEN